MEVWTFIHKETNDYIRFLDMQTSDDFGNKYFFTNNEFAPPWFTFKEDDIKFIIENKDFIHALYCMNYNAPSTELVNIDDYEVVKFQPS